MIKRVLIFLCLLFTVNSFLSANEEWKPGYVVKSSGDTIRGLLAFRGYMEDWKSCVFKANETDRVETFWPEELQVYYYDSGVRFEPKTILLNGDSLSCFMECLVKGIINLYYLQIETYSDIDQKNVYSFYAETSSGRLVELPHPYYEDTPSKVKFKNEKILIWLFCQHPEMKKSIQRVSYERRSMIEMFQKYHDLVCTDYSCIIYIDKVKKKKYYLTPWIGANLQFYKADRYSSGSLKGVLVSPSAGVTFSMTLNGFTDRFLFNAGLNISNINVDRQYNRSSGENSMQSIGMVKSEHISFKSVQLVNFYSLEYRLMDFKILPSFEFGLLHGYNIKAKNRYDISYWSDQIEKGDVPVLLNRSFNYWGNRYYVGFLASAGCIIPLSKGMLPVRLQYQHPLIPKQNVFKLTYSSLVLSIGYTFML